MQKVESLQYNAALAITEAWRSTSPDEIYVELAWETLTNRRWYRRLGLFFLIANNQAPPYLCNVISPSLSLWCRNKHENPTGNDNPSGNDNPNGTDNPNGNCFNLVILSFHPVLLTGMSLTGP